MTIAKAALVTALLEMNNLDLEGETDNTKIANALADAIEVYVAAGLVTTAAFGTPTSVVTP